MTTTSILALVESIERHGVDAPAALAFRSALRRAGTEAYTAGGLAALEALTDAVAAADPARAAARVALLRAVWLGLLPGPTGRAQE